MCWLPIVCLHRYPAQKGGYVVDTGVIRETLRRIAHGVALSQGQSSLGGIWRLWTMDIIKGTPSSPSYPQNSENNEGFA